MLVVAQAPLLAVPVAVGGSVAVQMLSRDFLAVAFITHDRKHRKREESIWIVCDGKAVEDATQNAVEAEKVVLRPLR